MTGILHSAQWIEHPLSIQEFMGSIPVGDSDFFFVPHSCQVDQLTFHVMPCCYSRMPFNGHYFLAIFWLEQKLSHIIISKS